MKRLWVTGYRSYELSIFSDKDPKLTVIKYTLTNCIKNVDTDYRFFDTDYRIF